MEYRSYKYNTQIIKTFLLNILKKNACQTIIDELLSQYMSDAENVNQNNIFIPGAIYNNTYDETLDEKNFIKQIFINDFTMNKFLESGTNYVLIDPNYFRHVYSYDTGEFRLENDRDTFKAINTICKFLTDSGNTIISQNIFSTDINHGTIYEICVDRKGCNTNKIYIVGSSFYFSYIINRVLFDRPSEYITNKEHFDTMSGFKKENYMETIEELRSNYNSQISNFKLLIEKSKTFFLFNCVQFVSSARTEILLFSMNDNIKKFINDNDFNNKINYFNLLYGSDYIYKYRYENPIIIRDKLYELVKINNYYIIEPEKKIIIPNMHKYLDGTYYIDITDLDDDSYNDDSIKKDKNELKNKLSQEYINEIMKNFQKDKKEGGYYEKYMKYKLKYLSLKKYI